MLLTRFVTKNLCSSLIRSCRTNFISFPSCLSNSSSGYGRDGRCEFGCALTDYLQIFDDFLVQQKQYLDTRMTPTLHNDSPSPHF